jgi:hypothetical protein
VLQVALPMLKTILFWPIGEKRTPNGEFYDFTPEWFYLGDPKSEYFYSLEKAPKTMPLTKTIAK